MIDERKQTIRQEIIDELESNALTVRDISQSIGILEKDVYHHLTFIEKTIKNQNKRIHVEPYYCMNCGLIMIIEHYGKKSSGLISSKSTIKIESIAGHSIFRP